MLNFPIIKTAGGSALNTMRAIQWILRGTGDANFIGCIGDDEFGNQLNHVATESGVKTHFMITSEKQTGCCASVIFKRDRTLIAHVSAPEKYSIDHFNSEKIQIVVNECEVLYSSGFFILSSLPTCIAIGKHAVEKNKMFMLNISANFIVESFWDIFYPVFQYADYVVGNEHETLAFSKRLGWDTQDYNVIAEKIANLPLLHPNKKRTVIITQGSNNTLVYQNDKLYSFPVHLIDKNLIADTNGAGDSFIGGFLAGYCLGKPLAKCIDAGHYCAGFIIQRTGCDFNDVSRYNFEEELKNVPVNE